MPDPWEYSDAPLALSVATATGPHPSLSLTPPAGVPDAPVETVTMHDVELCAAGDWTATTGPAPIDRGVLESILEAARDPEVDAAMVHPGHFDPRFPTRTDGEPTLGVVRPTRIETRGGREVLLGDISGIPSKLATVIRLAYPRRSVELAVGGKTPSGRVYRAALTGLGLLGVQAPAVKGLADIAARYSAPAPPAGGSLLSIVMGDTPPVPPGLPTASVSALHDGGAATPTTQSLEGATVPNTISDKRLRQLLGLAEDADVAAVQAVVAPLVAAVDENAAPPAAPAAAGTPAAAPAAPAATGTPAAAAPAVPAVPAAAAAPAAAPTAIAAAAGAELPAGFVVVEESVLSTLTSAATTVLADRREGILNAALSTGRIAPAEAAGWRAQLERDEQGIALLLNSLPENRVPVEARGSAAALAAGVHVDPSTDAAWLDFEAGMFGAELASVRALPTTPNGA